ncbi:MAG: 16S rRNA processing protein RimM, partial [Muribaculaceae bacterium]|nr:16S rRNA processing protein RimM [Muribaculaceae bacterium]
MITLKELYPIGYVAKTHGIKGELNVSLDTEFNPEDFKFLVFE